MVLNAWQAGDVNPIHITSRIVHGIRAARMVTVYQVPRLEMKTPERSSASVGIGVVGVGGGLCSAARSHRRKALQRLAADRMKSDRVRLPLSRARSCLIC